MFSANRNEGAPATTDSAAITTTRTTTTTDAMDNSSSSSRSRRRLSLTKLFKKSEAGSNVTSNVNAAGSRATSTPDTPETAAAAATTVTTDTAGATTHPIMDSSSSSGRRTRAFPRKRQSRHVRFGENVQVQVHSIDRKRPSMVASLFYSAREILSFKSEKFEEDAAEKRLAAEQQAAAKKHEKETKKAERKAKLAARRAARGMGGKGAKGTTSSNDEEEEKEQEDSEPPATATPSVPEHDSKIDEKPKPKRVSFKSVERSNDTSTEPAIDHNESMDDAQERAIPDDVRNERNMESVSTPVVAQDTTARGDQIIMVQEKAPSLLASPQPTNDHHDVIPLPLPQQQQPGNESVSALANLAAGNHDKNGTPVESFQSTNEDECSSKKVLFKEPLVPSQLDNDQTTGGCEHAMSQRDQDVAGEPTEDITHQTPSHQDTGSCERQMMMMPESPRMDVSQPETDKDREKDNGSADPPESIPMTHPSTKESSLLAIGLLQAPPSPKGSPMSIPSLLETPPSPHESILPPIHSKPAVASEAEFTAPKPLLSSLDHPMPSSDDTNLLPSTYASAEAGLVAPSPPPGGTQIDTSIRNADGKGVDSSKTSNRRHSSWLLSSWKRDSQEERRIKKELKAARRAAKKAQKKEKKKDEKRHHRRHRHEESERQYKQHSLMATTSSEQAENSHAKHSRRIPIPSLSNDLENDNRDVAEKAGVEVFEDPEDATSTMRSEVERPRRGSSLVGLLKNFALMRSSEQTRRQKRKKDKRTKRSPTPTTGHHGPTTINETQGYNWSHHNADD